MKIIAPIINSVENLSSSNQKITFIVLENYSLSNGNVYSGGWIDQKGFQGQGSYKYKNGDVYEGRFREWKRHGFG